jgi:hypothetical protein
MIAVSSIRVRSAHGNSLDELVGAASAVVTAASDQQPLKHPMAAKSLRTSAARANRRYRSDWLLCLRLREGNSSAETL